MMTDIPEPEYECDACRDRGWVVEPDGGAGGAARCYCDHKNPAENPKLVLSRLRAAGLQRDELESAFEPWDASAQPPPGWARIWLGWALAGKREDYPEELIKSLGPAPMNPWVLTLLGDPGRGKTKTAAVLLRIYVEQAGPDPLWARAAEAFDRVQRERSRDGESEYETQITEAGLLVLDELGWHHRKDPAPMIATVDEWLCRRHRRWAPTVITTNARDIDSLGDARITSRLNEGSKALMGGPNYRDRDR